jgi:hypothetical protein
MEKLNSSQRILLIVENLEGEVNNGGFDQFYFNSSGDYANETVDALNKIGANKTAEIVKKANDEFPNGVVPKNREKRQDVLDSLREKSSENWNRLESVYYGHNKEDGDIEMENLPALLIEFIKANKSDFKK